MTAIALVSAASVGSVGGAAGPADASLERLPRPAGERYTPVVQSVLSTPRWFKGADNRFHLVYELVLTNASPPARAGARAGGQLGQLDGPASPLPRHG